LRLVYLEAKNIDHNQGECHMRSRTRPRAVGMLMLATLVGSVGFAGLVVGRPETATGPSPEQGPQQKAGTPTVVSDEMKSILAVDDQYVVAYNKGDSKALAALFTEDADVVEADGRSYQGRESVEKAFAELFEAEKGIKVKLEIGPTRFLTKDVAKEEGRTIVTPAKGAPVSRVYTVLYVRKDGHWLMSSVKEDADPLVPPAERIKELDWMVGDWLDEGSDSEVRVQCKRSEDGNFLIRSFSIVRAGKPVMNVTQRVGWDPVAHQFRSWEFDSEGGFGEGRWSHSGDMWVVKQTGVRPEGVTASATNSMVRTSSDQVRWTSTDRVIGDESIPGEDSHVLVRVPPPPRTVPTPTTPVPSRNLR
jgi:uncharacterized protein (TIGR02246 family)